MRRAIAGLLVWAAQAGAAGAASAQGWTAQLVVPPLPSPYLSDWEMDPGAASIVVTNGTATTTDVTFHYSLTRNGQALLRGVTDPQTIAANATETFDATSSFGGRADWDRDVQDLVARTGRLPEGEFEGCVTIVDPGGLVLVPQQCVRFSTLYPDPPALVFPLNGDTVTTQDPIFEWLPVQLPQIGDGRIGYVLQIAEVNTTARQLPEVALSANLPHYLEPGLAETAHPYPVGAQPLVPGRTYAWRVQALDGDGRPLAANQGRSEVWTFVYREPASEVQAAVASIVLTPRRDTLRYTGDTARYEAKAYDADNVEIPGKRFAWRSLDTNIVRVDTLGVATGVSAGQTQIVASVDGVVDTALSVTTVPTGLAVGFERYDAATDQPALLELIKSGSFDEVVPQLMELLQSGQFRIPIPRLPGVAGQLDGAPEGAEGPGDREEREGGPRVGTLDRWRTTADETCENVRVPAEAVTDNGRQVWVVPFRLRGEDAELVQRNCVQVNTETEMVVDSTAYCKGTGHQPDEPTHENCPKGRQRWEVDTTYHETTTTTTTQDTVGADVALFGVSWATGLPRVFIAWKPPGDEFAVPGTSLRARFWVINLLRSGPVDATLLPPQYAGFFGGEAFDVGVGLTLYIKRRCGDSGFCDWVRWFYPNSSQHDLTIRAFAGVTANEVSIGTGGRGSATALGFSIQASFPVRTWNADLGGLSLDSTQFGLLFAAQDSVETPLRQARTHNVSIGVALALTVWWSTANNSWAATGSVGVERDPLKGVNKIVASLQLEALWKAWWIRVGNPQIIITRTMQADPIEWSYEITGTLGVGEWKGERAERFGVAEAGGGDQRGDIGGASLSGSLAEMARGQLKLTRTKGTPRPIGPLTQNATERQTAQDSLAKWQGIERDLRPKAETDEDVEREWRRANQRIVEWQSLLRSLGGPPPPPPSCQRENDGWCWAWSFRASLGPTAFTDFLITLGRFGVEAAKQ